MGNYSSKQQKFANYLCETFGMTESQFISHFLNYYAIQYGHYKQYQSGWYFNTSDAIDALKLEQDIRRKKNSLKERTVRLEHLRATDISNYTFCSSSFSISNSFEIDHPSGEKEREIGERLHDKLKLIKRVETYNKTGKIEDKLFDESEIIDILKSKNIYAGHSDNKKTFFNSELNIACEPDYIFVDHNSNYFIVEEKFQYKRDPMRPPFDDNWLEWNGSYSESNEEDRTNEINQWENYKPSFYLSHQMQVVTYLKSIKEYALKYGYLIYWYYDYKNGQEPYIHKVCVKKIELDQSTNQLFDSAYENLKQLISSGQQHFAPDKLNPNKCGGCVVNKYCGHKSKRYDKVTFPYDKRFLKLFPAKYAE